MLAVTDADEAARWYERALGARQLWNLGGVVLGSVLFAAASIVTGATSI
jgi:catechol 2,3-dioxygenase-like lactoylglutathione lyase family enzyme